MDEHGGLAAAGSGQQQKGALGGQGSLALHGVQVLEFRGNDGPAGGGKALAEGIVHKRSPPKKDVWRSPQTTGLYRIFLSGGIILQNEKNTRVKSL